MSIYFKSIVCGVIFCLASLGVYALYQRETSIINNQSALSQAIIQNQKITQDVVNYINQQIEASKQISNKQQPQKAQ